MSSLQLELADSKVNFRAGEGVEGVAFWTLAAAPQALELRLYWRTEGKGTTDLEVVRSMRFTGVQAEDRRPFRIELPAGPYSCSGKLVSIVWGLELVAEPKGESTNLEIVVSATGQEVRLDRTSSR